MLERAIQKPIGASTSRNVLGVAALALAVGCAERALPLPEASTDLSLIEDLAVPADLPSPPDSARPGDLPIPSDAARPPDLAPRPDLALPSLRLLAPLSTSMVTTHRPTLRWQGGGAGAQVELCRDRACTQILAATADTAQRQARPDAPLAPGVAFWRVRDGARVTPTWELFVGARDAALDNSYGSTLDVNGDGYGDVGVAELAMGTSPGAASIFLGGPNGLSPTAALRILSPDPTTKWWSFFAAASAGDLDGDGFGDFTVSSMPFDSSVPGIVRVYFGGPAGLRLTGATALTGPDAQSHFGGTVGGVGDVNGDGYGDLLVTTGGDEVSPLYIFYGGPDGVTQADPNRFVRLATNSPQAGEATAVGDFNGDGFGDLAIGSFGEGPGNAGRLYVYYGGPHGPSAPTVIESPGPLEFGFSAVGADVDGDGYCDIVASGGFNNTTFYVFAGSPTGVGAKPAQALAIDNGDKVLGLVGDFDGDGRDDVGFCSFSFRGGLWMFHGGSSAATELPRSEEVYAGTLGGTDVNGDGYADVLMGDPNEYAGRVYLFAGGPQPDGGVVPLVLVGNSDGGIDSKFGNSLAGRR